MTVAKNETKSDRKWTIGAGVLYLLGLVFMIVGLSIPSWTINESSNDREVEWHGLFYRCTRLKCTSVRMKNIFVIFLMFISGTFLLLGITSSILKNFYGFFRRYYYLTLGFIFLSLILNLIGVAVYAHHFKINGIAVRSMIFSMSAISIGLLIECYLSGKYAGFYEKNRAGYQLTATENTDKIQKIKAILTDENH